MKRAQRFRVSSRTAISGVLTEKLARSRKQRRAGLRAFACATAFVCAGPCLLVTETGSDQGEPGITGMVPGASPPGRACSLRARWVGRVFYRANGCVPQSGSSSSPPCVTWVTWVPSELAV